MAETRTDTNRVQRWREGKKKEGLKAVTIWLTTEEELRLKDLALQWHCSPSALVQQALAQFHPGPAQSNGNVTDSLQIRKLIREELAAMQAKYQVGNDPALRFVGLLQAALSCGRAHVADPRGKPPGVRP